MSLAVQPARANGFVCVRNEWVYMFTAVEREREKPGEVERKRRKGKAGDPLLKKQSACSGGYNKCCSMELGGTRFLILEGLRDSKDVRSGLVFKDAQGMLIEVGVFYMERLKLVSF